MGGWDGGEELHCYAGGVEVGEGFGVGVLPGGGDEEVLGVHGRDGFFLVGRRAGGVEVGVDVEPAEGGGDRGHLCVK